MPGAAAAGASAAGDSRDWADIKAGFLEMLSELERSEKEKGDMVRANAYSKAANALRDHGAPLASGKEAMKLKGIGKKIGAKFDEYLAKGVVGRVERDRSDPRAIALRALQSVASVGPVLAKQVRPFPPQILRQIFRAF